MEHENHTEEEKQIRLALTLTPELHATLKDMSDLFDKPMSKIVIDLLNDAHPALKKMVKLGKSVKGYQSKIGDMFARKRGVNVDQ
jgi:5-methylcytosine-specific restriction endonuclease McrBC GTP-binding regulatory subunit McrB